MDSKKLQYLVEVPESANPLCYLPKKLSTDFQDCGIYHILISMNCYVTAMLSGGSS